MTHAKCLARVKRAVDVVSSLPFLFLFSLLLFTLINPCFCAVGHTDFVPNAPAMQQSVLHCYLHTHTHTHTPVYYWNKRHGLPLPQPRPVPKSPKISSCSDAFQYDEPHSEELKIKVKGVATVEEC